MFGKRTVETVLAGITRSLGELEQLVEERHRLAAESRARAAEQLEDAKGHEAERDRAERVADKLRTLLS